MGAIGFSGRWGNSMHEIVDFMVLNKEIKF